MILYAVAQYAFSIFSMSIIMYLFVVSSFFVGSYSFSFIVSPTSGFLFTSLVIIFSCVSIISVIFSSMLIFFI